MKYKILYLYYDITLFREFMLLYMFVCIISYRILYYAEWLKNIKRFQTYSTMYLARKIDFSSFHLGNK